MCGIAGFIDHGSARSREFNRSLAREMSDALRHRGPDGSGVWNDPATGVWLAHRRLAIVDVTQAGSQPMVTPDGTGAITYNGEIYNAPELRSNLEAAGYRFKGHSDTEVLLYGCHHWGVEMTARRLVGMFAFAYWDSAARTLTLVRDRLGKKPLYWTNKKSLVFASELRALMLHPDTSAVIDRSSVAEYLRTLYIAAPHSIFEGVGKVEPGQILTFHTDSKRMVANCYWTALEAADAGFRDPFKGSLDDAVDETAALLAEAVRVRMISDVPLGAFLSGGVDSSAVVALMQAGSCARTKTFSIGYSDTRFDESAHARAVAQHLGTDHTELLLEPSDSLKLIPDLATIYDEPFADSSQIPTVLVSRLARQQVTVVLSGDGGDEVFAGYNRHIAASGLLPRLASLPGPVRTAMARMMTLCSPERLESLLWIIPSHRRPRLLGEKIHKMAALLDLDEAGQYRHLVSQWTDPEAIVIGARERHGLLDEFGLRGRFPDAVAWMRYLDLVSYLPGDILTKVDRASMSASLEVRAPLLDHRLVEFSFRVPSTIHLHEGRTKYLLRRVLDRHVPRDLIDRPKMGFGVPLGDWLRGPLRDWAEDLLSEDRLLKQGLLRPAPIRALWHRHLSGAANAQYQLWAILMLVAWRQSLDTAMA